MDVRELALRHFNDQISARVSDGLLGRSFAVIAL